MSMVKEREGLAAARGGRGGAFYLTGGYSGRER